MKQPDVDSEDCCDACDQILSLRSRIEKIESKEGWDSTLEIVLQKRTQHSDFFDDCCRRSMAVVVEDLFASPIANLDWYYERNVTFDYFSIQIMRGLARSPANLMIAFDDELVWAGTIFRCYSKFLTSNLGLVNFSSMGSNANVSEKIAQAISVSTNDASIRRGPARGLIERIASKGMTRSSIMELGSNFVGWVHSAVQSERRLEFAPTVDVEFMLILEKRAQKLFELLGSKLPKTPVSDLAEMLRKDSYHGSMGIRHF